MSSEEAEVVTHVLRTSTDYYAMLKVGRSATVAEIKTSYKRMALRLHPDKNKHSRAEECFKLLGKAHTTLADEQKRAVYDRGGEAAVQQSEGGGGGNARHHPFAGTPFGFQPGGATFRFHTGGGDDFVEDLFGMFFGGMDPRMHQQRRAQQQQQQQARAQQQQQYFRQQQYQQQQHQQRQRAGQQGGGGEGLTSILQFLPIILFLVVAMILQSSAFDPAPPSTGSRGHNQQPNVNLNNNQYGGRSNNGGADTRHRLYTLVADEYHPHERVTTMLDEEWVFDNSIDGGQSHRERGSTGGLRVSYFVNSHMFDRHLQQRRMSLRTVEEEVAKSKKESLERLCKSDQTMARAAKKKKISSVACDELEDFAPLRL